LRWRWRWRWLLILLLSARQIRRPTSRLGCRLNAGDVEWAERHGCRESRPPPWMADGGWRRAHGASPSLRNDDEGVAKPGARTLGYLVSFQVTRRRRNRSGVSQIPISRAAIRWSIQISSCTRNAVGAAGAVRQPRSGISVNNVLADPPPRCRRDLRRLPQVLRQIEDLRWRWLLILLLSARQIRRPTSRLGCRLNAGDVEWAERHGCRESRPPPWMADGGWRRAHGASPSLRNDDEGVAKPGARTLGYLVSFQVTRRRRNRSGVSQIPISRAAIRWSIQISSCTRNAVGAAGAVRQPRSGISVNNVLADPPPRCRRDLRRLPQVLRQIEDLRWRSLFDFASKRTSDQTPQIATWVQAERRRRGVGRAAWMPREPPPAMDGGWRRAHGASPE
jgi:hypothetical protein